MGGQGGQGGQGFMAVTRTADTDLCATGCLVASEKRQCFRRNSSHSACHPEILASLSARPRAAENTAVKPSQETFCHRPDHPGTISLGDGCPVLDFLACIHEHELCAHGQRTATAVEKTAKLEP